MRKLIKGGSKGEHLHGTNNDDTINGNGGNDTIQGNSGDDRLSGGAGHDKLSSGTGDDIFVFRSFNAADSDRVRDFQHTHDQFELDQAVFKAIDTGRLTTIFPAQFHIGASADSSSERIIYNAATGNVYYDDDGDGAHGQHLIATLDPHTKLTYDDFSIM